MKAILWGYKYSDMKVSWAKQMLWIANALKDNGYEVKKKNLKCEGLEAEDYNCDTDNPCDICLYNHIDLSNLTGNVVKAKRNWFFKPTVPDEVHTTLDELGYGPYSSVTYKKPCFKNVSIGNFFDTKVKDWINSGVTKWGSFKDKVDMPHKDYWLVLGQCGGDSVNTRHDFGDYFTKLKQVVTELARIDNRHIVVKLHPYTDGKYAKDTVFSDNLTNKLTAISDKVKVYNGKIGIHNFIKNCRAVILGNSGAGYEAMMHHKPIIAWGYPEYHWIAYDLRHLADLVRAIKLDWFDKDKQDKFLYWYLEKYCFYNQETCNDRVRELLDVKVDYDTLWAKHKPAQGYTEYKLFLEFIKNKLPPRPVVVEIGLRVANQRFFYKELFDADYKGIDIKKFDGDDFIHGDSKKQETLDELKIWLNGRKIDLLFIDGDHSYDGVKKDYELYSPLANVIAMHDINTNKVFNKGVVKLWKEIKSNKTVEFKCSNPKDKYFADGIGVILK